jgi:putative nucleotidyltransferase with HDIG domain
VNAREILATIESLPTMPAVAAKLLQAANDADVGLREIGTWLEHDSGMTTNLLRLCNSPFYGFRNRVTSVRQAVSLLGLHKVVQISLTLLASRHLVPEQKGYGLAAGELWRSSVTAALAAELLAEEIGYLNLGTAYTAGLLQDVGKIALAEFVGDALPRIRVLVEEEGLPWEQAELRVVGMPHTEAGAILLTRWEFPEILVESVRAHHDPSRAVLDPALARISHVANALAMTLGAGLGADGLAYALEEASLESLGVSDRGRIEGLMAELAERTRRADELFASGAPRVAGLANGTRRGSR